MAAIMPLTQLNSMTFLMNSVVRKNLWIRLCEETSQEGKLSKRVAFRETRRQLAEFPASFKYMGACTEGGEGNFAAITFSGSHNRPNLPRDLLESNRLIHLAISDWEGRLRLLKINVGGETFPPITSHPICDVRHSRFPRRSFSVSQGMEIIFRSTDRNTRLPVRLVEACLDGQGVRQTSTATHARSLEMLHVCEDMIPERTS